MALIKCPECGKEISDKAHTCISCGCPLNELLTTSGVIRIKIPNFVDGWAALSAAYRKATISTSQGKLLWSGKHGEVANFTVEEPVNVVITLGNLANNVTGIVYPRKRYTLVQDMGLHWRATFTLTEVDIIDAD